MVATPRTDLVHPLPHVDDYLVDRPAGRRFRYSPWSKRSAFLAIAWNISNRSGRTRPGLRRSKQTHCAGRGFLTDSQKAAAERARRRRFCLCQFRPAVFATSVVRQRLGIDLVFRVINTNVRTMDELGLPEHLKLLTRYQNGLILVTGSVGSGKSTTLAALVEQVNLRTA